MSGGRDKGERESRVRGKGEGEEVQFALTFAGFGWKTSTDICIRKTSNKIR